MFYPFKIKQNRSGFHLLARSVRSQKSQIYFSKMWRLGCTNTAVRLGCINIIVFKYTEYFGAQEVAIFFLNNIFNLKGSCVLRTLKNSFAIFERDGHIQG